MLSIGVMNGGQGQYYIDLAKEDYYLDGGEPPGKWLGRGAEALGLTGEVTKEVFLNLFHGLSPDGTAALVQNANTATHRPGRDLTFSAPKSVSVLWSQADDETRQVIQEALFEAVKPSLGYLEDKAAITRRGKGGTQREAARLFAATFEHGTSRAQDPQLHIHVLILNLGLREDGTVGSLDFKPLYQHCMAAGALFRAELAMQLEQHLNVVCERNKSWFEIKGIPREAIDEFSKRRHEIEAELDRLGLDGAKAAERAALFTREVKGHVARSDLFPHWHEAGTECGFGLEEARRVLGQIRPERAVSIEKEAASKKALSLLTEQKSFFPSGNCSEPLVKRHRGGVLERHTSGKP